MEIKDQAFLKRMRELLKDEYPAYLEALNDPPCGGLRINTNKISQEAFLKSFPYHLKKIPWTKDGFYYDLNDPVTKHPFYQAGLYYLQEPSAMLAGELLNLKENAKVLDMCAAPGGKSTKIAQSLSDEGLLVANDISASRCQALIKNLAYNGTKNYCITADDLSHGHEAYHAFFDAVILDAPCSGEGMLRKEPTILSKAVKAKETYTDLQKALLFQAASYLKPGGELLYITCTFDIQENEAVIAGLLAKDPAFEVLEIPMHAGFMPGIIYDGHQELQKAVRLYPHKIQGEGHFICHLKKAGELLTADDKAIMNKIPPLFEPFLNTLPASFKNRIYMTINDTIYLLPAIPLPFDKQRILRSGLKMGELKKERFEPSQELALALKDNEYPYIDLKDDLQVSKYLKGETLNLKETYPDGYYLIGIAQQPLGFAKIAKGIFKNKIAPGYIRA